MIPERHVILTVAASGSREVANRCCGGVSDDTSCRTISSPMPRFAPVITILRARMDILTEFQRGKPHVTWTVSEWSIHFSRVHARGQATWWGLPATSAQHQRYLRLGNVWNTPGQLCLDSTAKHMERQRDIYSEFSVISNCLGISKFQLEVSKIEFLISLIQFLIAIITDTSK